MCSCGCCSRNKMSMHQTCKMAPGSSGSFTAALHEVLYRILPGPYCLGAGQGLAQPGAKLPAPCCSHAVVHAGCEASLGISLRAF